MSVKSNKSYFLVIIGIYLYIFLAVSQNLRTPQLSYDESIQFWISKGIGPDEAPLTDAKGLLSVIEINKYKNMEPSGFSILLHFWTYISNHHVWLRLLPFLFLIGCMLSFIYLSYLWLKNLSVAILMGFIPVIDNMLLYLGFDIRGYSMEALGTIMSLIALESLKNKITFKSLFLWSCVLSVFMTSRYAELIIVFIVSLCILYQILITKSDFKKKLLLSLVYAIPILITLFYIYFFALRFQNVKLEPLYYLPYLSKDKSILFESQNFLFLCAIGVLTVLFFIRNRYSVIKKYEMLLFVTISVNIIFIILSFLGKYPWSSSCSRCISLILLVIICFAAFIGELLMPLFHNPGILKYYFITSVLVFTIYLKKGNNFMIFDKNSTYSELMNIVSLKNYQKIYVDRTESPYIKYLFEYGGFKGYKENIYPGRFTFVKYQNQNYYEGRKTVHEWYAKQPKMNELMDYDLLITPELYKFGNNDKWMLIEGTTNFYIKKKEVLPLL